MRRVRSSFRHFLLIVALSSLALSSVALNLSHISFAQGYLWVHTTGLDFVGGSGWNVDVNSSPGNVTLLGSMTTMVKSRFNPGLRQGPFGTWDDSGLANPIVLKEDGMYRMWYAGDDTGTGSYRIGYAVSSDGVNWTKARTAVVSYGGSLNNNIVLDLGTPGSGEDVALVPGTIIHNLTGYHMWYSCKGDNWSLCYASSSDGIVWIRYPLNPISDIGGQGILSPVVTPSSLLGYDMVYAWVTQNGVHRLGNAWSATGTVWIHDPPGEPEAIGPKGTWNELGILPGSLIQSSGINHLWFSAIRGSDQSIGYTNYSAGTTNPLNQALTPGKGGQWDSVSLSRPWVIKDGARLSMWYAGFDGMRWSIGLAASAYGDVAQPPRTNPVLQAGSLDMWDSGGVFRPSIVKKDGVYHMWYTGSKSLNGSTGFAIGYATSVDGVSWRKSQFNPVLSKNTSGWDSEWVGFAWVIWDDFSGRYKMWYTGSNGSTIGIGLATSQNGTHWQRGPSNPVVFTGYAATLIDDTRCPWVGNIVGSNLTMFVGARSVNKVSIIQANSSDGGLSWNTTQYYLKLEPIDGTWQSASVSCPVVNRQNLSAALDIFYEGSTSLAMPGLGGVGSAMLIHWDSRFSLHDPEVAISGTKDWNSQGLGGPAVVFGDRTHTWFHGSDGITSNIGLAHGKWTYQGASSWADTMLEPISDDMWHSPVVLEDQSNPVAPWIMYDAVGDEDSGGIGCYYSFDGMTWTQCPNVEIQGPSPGGWDGGGFRPLSVVRRDSTVHMWYAGRNSTSGLWSVGHATGLNTVFLKSPVYPVLSPCDSSWWDCGGIKGASVIFNDVTNRYEMWYSGFDGSTWRIGFAYSQDGTTWKKAPSYPVLYPSGDGSWDSVSVANPTVILEGGVYHMFYSGYDGRVWSLGHAFSMNGINWVRSRMNPILGGDMDSVRSGMDVRHAFVHKKDSRYMIWFSTSEDETAQIAYAESVYLSVGEFISAPIDSNAGGPVNAPAWGNIRLTTVEPHGTAIAIALRTGIPPSSWNDWSLDYFDDHVEPALERERYLQYRLTLLSFTGDDVPVVEEVGGEYEGNKAPFATPLTPANGICTSEIQPTFSWTYSDPEGDAQSWVMIQEAVRPEFKPSDILHQSSTYTTANSFRPNSSFTLDMMYYWRVMVADEYGELSQWSEGFEIIIDTKAPQTRLEAAPPPVSGYVSIATLFTFNVTDEVCGGGSTYYSVDGGAFQQYTTPFSLGTQGMHTIRFYSVDGAGNVEAEQQRLFDVDGTAPVTTAVIPDVNVTLGGRVYMTSSVPIVLLGSDIGSGLQTTQFRIDAILDWTNDSIIDLRGLSGAHTLHYRSIDNVWNVEPTSSLDIFVDDSKPVTTLDVEGPQTLDSPKHVTPATQFNLSAIDSGVGVKGTYYQIDGSSPPLLYCGNFSIGNEGLHTISYFSVDRLNNTEQKRSFNIVVDGSGPATSLIPLGPMFVGKTEMFVMSSTLLTLSSHDDGSALAGISYKIDGGAWSNYTVPFKITDEGAHTLSFYGIDVLGNLETERVVNILVDDSPPHTDVSLSGVAVEYDNRTYIDDRTTIVLDTTDDGSGALYARYRVDGGGWVLYSQPFTLFGSGVHIVDVQATDNLGLSEPPHSLKVVLDDSPPVARAGQDIATFAPATIALEGSASTDDTLVVGYTWLADSNGTVILDAASGTVTLSSPGTYGFTLTVRDPLGRESSDNLTVRLLRDPDTDKDLLPDVWEMQRFGNLTYGPNDDPDGDGTTNMQDYQHEGDAALDGGAGVKQPDDSAAYETLILVLLTLVGVLAGVVVLQVARNREQRRRLDERRAEESVEVEWEEEDEF